ncbi:hypothetical protein Q7P35_008744 [Cladosporium inversicolor]
MAVLYEMSTIGVPLFIRGLTQLSHNIEKAESWANENNVSSEQLAATRLHPDMLPLSFQVQFACNVAKGVLHRVAGLEWVVHEDNETNTAQLKDRIERTLKLLRDAEGNKDAFKGKEDTEVSVQVPGKEFKFTGTVYISYWSIPNFYFHITTAYDIMRKEGVPLGKPDFLGRPNHHRPLVGFWLDLDPVEIEDILESPLDFARSTKTNPERVHPNPISISESAQSAMSKQFTANEVKEAGSVEKGLHIIIDNNVYEMGSFVDEHPGGAKILKRVGGKDASKQFWKYHNESVLKKYQERLKVGTLKESAKL